jgi:GNAT superfamily N-acetyltransferase
MFPYLIAGAIGFVVAKLFEEDESPKFEDGGSVLLAPNGKPSNLTPEQYKLVRSSAFKKWFGDWENDRENSGKVSGITKEPVVFYHSTKSNFLSKKGENIFKNPPFFFSFKEDVSDYIVRIQHQNKKGRVYTKPFFLKYHNTFDLSQVKILKDKELTRLIKKHTFHQTESDIRLFELQLSLSKFRQNTWFLTENEDFQDYIKNKGYDSFVVYEDGDKNIAVFNPNQIKLADGSNTTFDGNNPDIRFDGGGEVFYHGSTDKNLEGKKGIHIGTKLASTEALESRIGVPSKGEWDGKRKYGKTLLAGKKRLKELEKERGYYLVTGYNTGRDIPEEDYYPTQRKERAVYSDGTPIPFDSKPIVFPVKIKGRMTNSKYNPHTDDKANSMMLRNLKMGNAKSGYYYTNIAEDEDSISAVVPDKSFIEIIDNNPDIRYAGGGDIEKYKIFNIQKKGNYINFYIGNNKIGYVEYYYYGGNISDNIEIFHDEFYMAMIELYEEYRGKNYSEIMIEYIKDYAKSLGATIITLRVDYGMGFGSERNPNYGLEKIYLKNGFKYSFTEEEADEDDTKDLGAMEYILDK